MKDYMKPEAEVIRLAAKEAIADDIADASKGAGYNPFSVSKDDPDADRR